MTRRSALAISASAAMARSVFANESSKKRVWTSSPLGTFSHSAVYEATRGGAICYIYTLKGVRQWYVADDADEFSYVPEIHISPNERFAAMVQKAGSTHVGINVFSIAPKTLELTKLFTPYLDAQSQIWKFHRISDEFHHFDLSFISWSVRSDCFLFRASGAAFKHGVSRFVLGVSVPGAVVSPADGFEEHNRTTLKTYD